MAKRQKNLHINNYVHDYNDPHLKIIKSKNLDKLSKLHNFKLKEIFAKTQNQSKTFDAFYKDKNLLLHGSAGTGKTFISMFLGLDSILNNTNFYNLSIVRSAVPTREVGHLPGDLDKKIEIYELPYKQIVNDLLNRGDAYEIMKKKRKINFISTSFVRGLTFENSIVLVDEIQNLSFHELDSVMTRIGENCKIIFSGDFKQSDLKSFNEKQGLHNFMEILSGMKNFETINFKQEDIVRSSLVKDYIICKENLNIL